MFFRTFYILFSIFVFVSFAHVQAQTSPTPKEKITASKKKKVAKEQKPKKVRKRKVKKAKKTPQVEVQETVFSSVDPDSLNDKAIRLAEDGYYQRAIDLLLRASKIRDQQNAILFHNLGYAYQLVNETEKAIEAYQAALKRDENILITNQNLGRLLYQTRQYSKAVVVGEKILQLDPFNETVGWLPDAYSKTAKQKISQLRQGLETQEDVPEETQKPQPPQRKITQSFDAIDRFTNQIQFGFLFSILSMDSKPYLLPQKGILKIPAYLHLNLFLWERLQISINSQTPYSGSLAPGFLFFQQTVEMTYLTKSGFFVGAGMMYMLGETKNSVFAKGKTFLTNPVDSVFDTKIGFTLGGLLKGGIFSFVFYPRYIIQDPKKASGQKTLYDRMDVDIYLKKSLFKTKKRKIDNMAIVFRTHFGEDYFTEYNTTNKGNIAHYFGLYTLELGLDFDNITAQAKKIKVDIGFLVGAYLYIRNLDNPNIVSIGKGQGFFGFNGESLPVEHISSTVVTFYSRQVFSSYFSLKEKIITEFFWTKNAPYKLGLLFELSLGFRF